MLLGPRFENLVHQPLRWIESSGVPFQIFHSFGVIDLLVTLSIQIPNATFQNRADISCITSKVVTTQLAQAQWRMPIHVLGADDVRRMINVCRVWALSQARVIRTTWMHHTARQLFFRSALIQIDLLQHVFIPLHSFIATDCAFSLLGCDDRIVWHLTKLLDRPRGSLSLPFAVPTTCIIFAPYL